MTTVAAAAEAPNLETLVEELGNLTVLEARDLTRRLEEKWGVSANTPIGVVPTVFSTDPTVPEVKTVYDVILKVAGPNKVNVIKEVRACTDLGLLDAKTLVESAPKILKEIVPKEEAQAIQAKFKALGAEVELI